MIKHLINSLQRNKIDILAWSIFILYETLMVGIAFHIYTNPIIYIFHYTVIIFFFYGVGDYILPYCFSNRKSKPWYFILFLALALSGYILLQFFVDIALIHIHVIKENGDYRLNMGFVVKNAYRAFYFIGLSTVYFYVKSSKQNSKIQEELKETQLLSIIKQKTTEEHLYKAQNSLLKAQINPHFLFNTLNFIYTEIKPVSENASEAVILLSRMMRFAINANEEDQYIVLGEEIEQIENLIKLHHIGKDYREGIFLNYTPNVLHLRIIPLILLTLAENMIKHGILGLEDSESTININRDEEFLYISTSNIAKADGMIHRDSQGLINICERLKYEYGEGITFSTNRSDMNVFSVRIVIEILSL